MTPRCLRDGREMRRVVVEQTPVQKHVKRERYECPDCPNSVPIWWEIQWVVEEWLQRQRPSHKAFVKR